jgi:hypothetical protein
MRLGSAALAHGGDDVGDFCDTPRDGYKEEP